MVPGFGIRITDKGVRSFIYVYTSAMKKRRVRVTLGRVGEIDLETARNQAREPGVWFGPGRNVHLYAKTNARLTDEHIVPFSLAGHHASFSKQGAMICADLTCQLEPLRDWCGGRT